MAWIRGRVAQPGIDVLHRRVVHEVKGLKRQLRHSRSAWRVGPVISATRSVLLHVVLWCKQLTLYGEQVLFVCYGSHTHEVCMRRERSVRGRWQVFWGRRVAASIMSESLSTLSIQEKL